jgi:ABC-type dipeptide/oligopeptide/nickel transport system permease subunit
MSSSTPASGRRSNQTAVRTLAGSVAEAADRADLQVGGRAGVRSRTLWQDALVRLGKDPLVVVCLLYLGLLITLALAPQRFAPLSYEKASFSDKLAPPGALAGDEKLAGHRYWLGADRLGRDILSRLIFGTRVSIFVAFVGAGISFVIGVAYGLLSGYSSPRVDNLLMRVVDVVYAYPALILIILLQVYLTALGQREPAELSAWQRLIVGLDRRSGGLFFIFVAIGAVNWLNMARLTRGQVLHYRQQEFVQAALVIGAPHRRIMGRHLLPNVIGPCIVAETLAIPAYIYTEAFLSFIGLGVQPPVPSWGSMISDGYTALRAAPHVIFFPALTLSLTMLAFNFLGDALRDALDPRLRDR